VETLGAPLGIPTAVRGASLRTLKRDYPWFFCVVKVKEIFHRSALPVSSTLSEVFDEDGKLLKSRSWGCPTVGSLMELTSVDIRTYERNGIYFEDVVPYALGYNSGKVEFDSAALIRKLFDKRREAKRSKKKALANGLKLLMNSVYGKTIQRENDTSVTIYRGSFDEMIQRVSKYYNRLEFVLKIQSSADGKANVYYIRKHEPTRHYSSLCHFGCLLLSVSKDLMQRGIYISETLKGREVGTRLAYDSRFLYTDTDSYFCYASVLTKSWKQLFRQTYGVDPMSSELGALDSDIKVTLPADGEWEQAEAPPVIYCGYFLAKKVYYLRYLAAVRRKGREEVSYVVGETVRAKGISKNAITHCVENKYEGSCLKLFQALARGESITFDLAAEKLGKLKLDPKTQSYCITRSFTRTICFK